MKKRCIINGVLDDNIKLIDRIGTSSYYGEAYSVNIDNKFKAIKKIPMTNYDYQVADMFENKDILEKSDAWAEIYFLKIIGRLNSQKITPHVPKYYKYYICDDCKFSNEYISKSLTKDNKCIILLNDLADGDFKKYLKNNKDLSVLDLYLAYFQICMGIYAIQKYFGIIHGDLHYGNVLYKKVPKGYNRYTLNGKKYYVYNNGLLFYLWDFGFASIKGRLENNYSKTINSDMKSDFKHIIDMVEGTGQVGDNVWKNLRKSVKKSNNSEEFIEEFLQIVSEKRRRNTKVLNRYSIDKKLNTNGLILF
jgi:hypothetical protein